MKISQICKLVSSQIIHQTPCSLSLQFYFHHVLAVKILHIPVKMLGFYDVKNETKINHVGTFVKLQPKHGVKQ